MTEERPDRMYYLGTGKEGFPGVPRRDLMKEDTARLSESQLNDVLAGTIYQKTKPRNRQEEEVTREQEVTTPVESGENNASE